MSKHKSNVGITGKEPESPQVQIPKHLYGLLQTFKDEYGTSTCKKMLQEMLIQTQFTNGFDGKHYSQLTEFTFFSILFLDYVEKYIPGEFDNEVKSVA